MTTRVLAIALLFLAAGSVQADRVGLRSLQVDPGAAASGMGTAYVAVAEDGSALYWNTAGLTQGDDGYEVLVAHTEWFLDVRQEYAVAVYRQGNHAFAAGISGFWLGGIERREFSPVSEPLGDFGYYDLVVPVAYAHRFGPVRAGGAIKPWYSKIDRETAHGIALDLGLMYDAPIEGLRIGGAIANIGSDDDFSGNEPRYIDEGFSLPLDLRIGASYNWRLSDPYEILLSGQIREIRDEETKGEFGAEVRLHRDFSVRGGYKAGYDLEDWSIGFAARRDVYLIQYAAVPFSSDFGTSHRFSLSFIR